MKQFLLAAALCLSIGTASAQMRVGDLLPTTQEEYNYATLGLKTQRAQGLDMKRGYSLTNRFEIPSIDGFTVVIEDLIRDADKSLACTIVSLKHTSYSEPSLLALPNMTAPKSLLQDYFKRVSVMGTSSTRVLAYALSFRTQQLEQYYMQTKK